jgi:hypothetical protein
MPVRSRGVLAATLCSALLAPAAAQAAPVTVSLRVEGPTRTLYEGRVTTDVRPFRFTGGTETFRCDATAANGTANTTPAPTRGAALATAAEQTPFAIAGTFSTSVGSPSFTTIAGEGVAYEAATNRYLVEFKNGVPSQFGSCGDPIAEGDDVLFAYGTGDEALLRLSGPERARPGEPVPVKVVDQRTGTPVAGAAIDGRTTGTDGTAVLGPFTERGDRDAKATKAGAIRSNRLRVCVTDGADGFCGTARPGEPGTPTPPVTPGRPEPGTGPTTPEPMTPLPDREAPKTLISFIADGERFTRARAPRLLRGTAGIARRSDFRTTGLLADPSGIAAVELRLTRTDRGRCSRYDGRRERFVRARRCGARGAFFRIAERADWEYQLAERLPRGRYVLDVRARDGAGNRDDQRRRGENRVVFRVR